MNRLAPRVGSVLLLIAVLGSWLPPGVDAVPQVQDRSARPRVPITSGDRQRGSGTADRAPFTTAATAGRSMSAPSNEGGFLGLTGKPNISPSDTTGAAGPSHVVTAVNVEYAVYPKDQLASPPGAPAPLATGSLRSLFPNLRGFVFDPKVVYDHYRGRYVLVFLLGRGAPFSGGKPRSRLLIVIIPEATAGDTSTWCRRNVNADQIGKDGKQFADYPGLGFDERYVYVTTNQFQARAPEQYAYAQIMALGKTRLYRCRGKPKIEAFGGRETREPGGGPAFTIQPAVTESELGRGSTEYLVSFQDRSCGTFCGDRLTAWRLKRRRGGLDLARDSFRVPRSFLGLIGTQRDGDPRCMAIETCWDAGDLRLVTAFYDADRGTLYTGHAVMADFPGTPDYQETAVRWYAIDPAPIKRSRLLRTGLLGAPDRDAGWPAMATDAAGTLFVTYSQAGALPPGEYLSAYAATIPPGATDPDGTTVLVPGESLYVQIPGRAQRWGDFAAANRDPGDPFDVWMVNQYARSDGTPPTTPIWQQTVHRVSSA